MPVDWGRPATWPAYVAIGRDGASLTEAGELCGVRRSTVSGWVVQWRARWGSDLLREGRRRPGGIAPGDAILGARLRGLATAESWAEVRAASASRYGILSDTALAAALVVIEDTFADPVKRAALTITDARLLAHVADMAARRADALSDVAVPTRGGFVGGSTPGIMDGLDALPAGVQGGEVIEMIEVVTRGIRHRIAVEEGAEPDDVELYDTTSRAAG